MKWRKDANLIIVVILSIAYTIVTLLNILGPLHVNSMGQMNTLSAISLYSVIYWMIALLITWIVYFSMRKKPEYLFFTLIILGMCIIILEIFLWARMV